MPRTELFTVTIKGSHSKIYREEGGKVSIYGGTSKRELQVPTRKIKI